MITVTFLREDHLISGFSCDGHAEYADPGSDIICSAVSALTQTAVMGIVQVAQISAGYSVSEGDLHCILSRDADEEQCSRADLLFKTMEAGLRAVDQAYPGYLKFIDREV